MANRGSDSTGGLLTPREQRQEHAKDEVLKTLRRENEAKDQEIAKLKERLSRAEQRNTTISGEVESLRADNKRITRSSSVPAEKLGAPPDVLFFDLMKRSKKVMVLIADPRTFRIVVANRKAEAFFGDIVPATRDLKELVLDKLIDPAPVHTETSQVGLLPESCGRKLMDKLHQQVLSGAFEPIVEDCFDIEPKPGERVEVEVTLEWLEDRGGQPWIVASLYDLTKARKDFLTGLWNKKVMQTVLDREIGRRQERVKALVRQKCAAAGVAIHGDRLSPGDMRAIGPERMREFIKDASHMLDPLSFIMIDGDRFKDVNDMYGHQVGDQVLRAIARRVMETVRHSDVVARYGGEEFAGVLVNTDLLTAQAIAERIRWNVASTPISVGQGATRQLLNMTVSVGVTTFHPSDLTIARKDGGPAGELIRRADVALYRAKDLGRNRVETVMAGEDAGSPHKAA